METNSVKLTFHNVAGRPRRSIAVRFETLCGYGPCGKAIVLFRWITEHQQPRYYCCKTHKDKASAERNGNRLRGSLRAGRRGPWQVDDKA